LKRQELLVGFLLGFASLLIIFVLSSDFSAHYEVCETTKEGAKDCASYGVLSYALHEVGAALDSYNGLITAMATAFIAWFTLSLRRSTDKLWDAGERQLKLLADTSAAQSRDMQESIKVASDYARAATRAAEAADKALILNERAWIDFELTIIGPLSFTAEGCDIELKATLKNIGRKPAIGVSFEYDLCASHGVAVKRHGELKKSAEENKSTGLGPPLFPERAIEEDRFWPRISRKELDESIAAHEKLRLELYVVGCASYFLPNDRDARVTTFFQEVIRPGVAPFDTAAGTVYELGEIKYLGGGSGEAT
jgi:hypothetical protein